MEVKMKFYKSHVAFPDIDNKWGISYKVFEIGTFYIETSHEHFHYFQLQTFCKRLGIKIVYEN